MSKQHPSSPTNSPAIPFIISGQGIITAVIQGKTYTIGKDFPTYNDVKQALKDKDAAAFINQVDKGEVFRSRSNGKVTIENGEVFFQGNPVHNTITDRMFRLIKEGFDFKPMMLFLEKCLKNIEPRAIDELYLFLEQNELPITEDGNFLAYRNVDESYLSMRANPDGTKNRNMVGDVVKMKREEVCSDRNQTCSSGLHFCSVSYLQHYPGKKTMIVEIDPRNVISFPIDYNNQKGRACEYKVVAEAEPGAYKEELGEAPVYKVQEINGVYSIKPSGQKYYSKRDSTGKFSKD